MKYPGIQPELARPYMEGHNRIIHPFLVPNLVQRLFDPTVSYLFFETSILGHPAEIPLEPSDRAFSRRKSVLAINATPLVVTVATPNGQESSPSLAMD